MFKMNILSSLLLICIFLSPCYSKNDEVLQEAWQSSTKTYLIEYLDKHKVLYQKDWTKDEVERALKYALNCIENLTQASACTLLSMLDMDEHEAYDIRKSYLWWPKELYGLPILTAFIAFILPFKSQFDQRSVKNASVLAIPAFLFALLFNYIEESQFDHFQKEILPISNELYEVLFEALKQKIGSGDSTLSLIDAFAKTKVLYKKDWNRCAAERALAQDIQRIKSLSKVEAKALRKEVKKNQDKSRDKKDNSALFLGFNRYYDHILKELEQNIGYEPFFTLNRMVYAIGSLVVGGTVAALVTMAAKPVHINDPGTAAITRPISEQRAAVLTAVIATSLLSTLFFLVSPE